MVIIGIIIKKYYYRQHCFCRPTNSEIPHHAILPSWEPDWSQPILTPWGGYVKDNLFHASGNEKTTSIQAHAHTVPNVLTIEGRFLGTLSQMGSAWLPD